MVPPRKLHTKSRNGCNTCKSRRVKCDERKPTCQNCRRRKSACSYGDPAAPSPRTSTSGGTQPDEPTRRQQDLDSEPTLWVAQNPSPVVPVQDVGQRYAPSVSRAHELYLMHHYATVTFATLSNEDSPQEADLWKTRLPLMARDYEFLMDGLLALSSSHLAHLEPSRSQIHTEVAIHYQTCGLNGFKLALGYITEANCHALFAFSILIALLGYSIPAISSDEPIFTPAESLISVFQLLRGVAVITQTREDILREGIFKVLLQPSGGPSPGSRRFSLGGLEQAMLKLRERADQVAKYVGPTKHQVHISGIESLETSFEHIDRYRSVGVVIAWPILNEEIMLLFQQGDPMAQIILVHYGVMLLYVHDRWWGRGFGIHLINSLAESVRSVDDDWDQFTEWARDCAAATRE